MIVTALKAGFGLVLMSALLLAAPASAAPERGLGPRLRDVAPADWVPGQLVVQFRDGVTRTQASRAVAAHDGRSLRRIPALGVDVVKLAPGTSVRTALASYLADPRVETAEPNFVRHAFAPAPDPRFGDLWGLENTGQLHPLGDDGARKAAGTIDADIDAPAAWAHETGAASTVIAVVDTGVDVSHPDLRNSLWRNPGEKKDGLDNDGNGKVDDVNGWNFAGDNGKLLGPSTAFGFEHGTHVAGTIAAERNNGVGVAGVCPACKVMVLRIMDDQGQLTLSAELAALAYAKAKGAQIVNASFGSSEWSALERNALATGGFLAVVAAGNDSLDNDMAISADTDGDGAPDTSSPSYPASYTLPNILTVAASNHSDEYAYTTACHVFDGFTKSECGFTSWGHDSVDVAAPGVDVESTVPGPSYATFDGTSMAAPHVAGLAGLVKSAHPEYTPVQVKNAVMHSVDRPTTLSRIFSPSFTVAPTGQFTRTSGRVNALTALTASPLTATPLTDGNVDGAKSMTTGSVTGSVRWPGDINDVWKRRLVTGGVYRLSLDGPANKDFDLFVWKPGTVEIWQFTPACNTGASACKLLVDSTGLTADESATFTAPTTGTYFFHVSAWLQNAGAYTLTIRRLS